MFVNVAVQILGALQFIDIYHVRAYLLEKTQHLIAGGFGKLPGDPPDLYHAYLGLAALALIDGHKDEGATIGPGVEDANQGTNKEGVTTEKGRIDASNRRESGSENKVLRALDPTLCFSVGARRWVESLSWRHQQEVDPGSI